MLPDKSAAYPQRHCRDLISAQSSATRPTCHRPIHGLQAQTPFRDRRLNAVLGDVSIWAILVGMLIAYVAAVRYAAKGPDLSMDIDAMTHLPPAREILKTGLHYIMPILLLMYLLMIERKSPGLSAFWSTVAMLFILLTQNPLKAYFRGQGETARHIREGLSDIAEGMIAGARNMIGLAAAMGVAGIIVGAVTLTGIGQVMAEFVEFLSGGRLLWMLFFVAVISIILGMGLPTTAKALARAAAQVGDRTAGIADLLSEKQPSRGTLAPLKSGRWRCGSAR